MSGAMDGAQQARSEEVRPSMDTGRTAHSPAPDSSGNATKKSSATSDASSALVATVHAPKDSASDVATNPVLDQKHPQPQYRAKFRADDAALMPPPPVPVRSRTQAPTQKQVQVPAPRVQQVRIEKAQTQAGTQVQQEHYEQYRKDRLRLLAAEGRGPSEIMGEGPGISSGGTGVGKKGRGKGHGRGGGDGQKMRKDKDRQRPGQAWPDRLPYDLEDDGDQGSRAPGARLGTATQNTRDDDGKRQTHGERRDQPLGQMEPMAVQAEVPLAHRDTDDVGAASTTAFVVGRSVSATEEPTHGHASGEQHHTDADDGPRRPSSGLVQIDGPVDSANVLQQLDEMLKTLAELTAKHISALDHALTPDLAPPSASLPPSASRHTTAPVYTSTPTSSSGYNPAPSFTPRPRPAGVGRPSFAHTSHLQAPIGPRHDAALLAAGSASSPLNPSINGSGYAPHFHHAVPSSRAGTMNGAPATLATRMNSYDARHGSNASMMTLRDRRLAAKDLMTQQHPQIPQAQRQQQVANTGGAVLPQPQLVAPGLVRAAQHGLARANTRTSKKKVHREVRTVHGTAATGPTAGGLSLAARLGGFAEVGVAGRASRSRRRGNASEVDVDVVNGDTRTGQELLPDTETHISAERGSSEDTSDALGFFGVSAPAGPSGKRKATDEVGAPMAEDQRRDDDRGSIKRRKALGMLNTTDQPWALTLPMDMADELPFPIHHFTQAPALSSAESSASGRASFYTFAVRTGKSPQTPKHPKDDRLAGGAKTVQASPLETVPEDSAEADETGGSTDPVHLSPTQTRQVAWKDMQLKKADERIIELEAEKTELRSSSEAFKRELKDAKEHVERMKSDKRKASGTLVSLKDKVRLLEADMDATDKKYRERKEDLQRTEAALKAAEQDVAAAEKRAKEADARCAAAQSLAEDRLEDNKKLQRELAEVKADYEMVVKANERSEATITDMTRQLSQLRQQIHQSQGTIHHGGPHTESCPSANTGSFVGAAHKHSVNPNACATNPSVDQGLPAGVEPFGVEFPLCGALSVANGRFERAKQRADGLQEKVTVQAADVTRLQGELARLRKDLGTAAVQAKLAEQEHRNKLRKLNVERDAQMKEMDVQVALIEEYAAALDAYEARG